MPSQDWYRPGKNYLRRDSAKFRYTKRNAKLVPPFGCSQKLGYCDSDSDNRPDKILKQYRSPALKKGYGCHPFDGPVFLESLLRIPNVGPSIFEVEKSEPKSGPLSFSLDVIRPASPASSFEAEVLVPVFTNNLFLFVKVLPPNISVSSVSAEVLIPELSESLGVSTEVVVPRFRPSGVSAKVIIPVSGVSSVSSEVLIPELSESLDLSAEVLVPSSGSNDISVEVIIPVSGVSSVSSEVLIPELSESLDLSAEVLVPSSGSNDISVEVVIPVSGVSSVSSEVVVPESAPQDISAEVLVPISGSDNISAEVIIPVSQVSSVSSEVLVPISGSHDISAEVVAPQLGSHDISAEVIIPASGASTVFAEVLVPESAPHGISAEVLVPSSGSNDISAEVIIPVSGVSTVSAEVLVPISGSHDISAEVVVPQHPPVELSAEVLIPASEVLGVSAEVLPPKSNGPSALNLVLVLPPTASISGLETVVKVPESSVSLNLSSTVLAPNLPITTLSAEVVAPLEGINDLGSFVIPVPSAGSTVSGLETVVKVPESSGSLNLSSTVLVSSSPITNLSAEIPVPGEAGTGSNVSGLEAVVKIPELSSSLDLSATVLVSSSPITNLSAEVESPLEGISDLVSEVIPWPSTGSTISGLEAVVKTPELSSSLDLSATVLVSSSPITTLSTEVESPLEGISDLASEVIPWPSTGSNVSGLEAVVKIPELSSSLDLSATVLVSGSPITNLSVEVESPLEGISNLDAFVNTPALGPSDLLIEYTNQNLVLSAPTQTASFNQSIVVSSGGVFIIPFNVGSGASTYKFHLNAFGSPDRFQILYDNSGSSDLLSDSDIVADSLFVGDNLSSTNPSDGTRSLAAYVYVGEEGDSFNSKFNNVGSETITVTASNRAPLTGFRTTANPNGGHQIGVQNEVYTSSTDTREGLAYSDGNICLTLTKPISTNTIAYLKIYSLSSASASSVVKIENI